MTRPSPTTAGPWRSIPSTSNAYCNRGNVWNDKGEYDKAIADYNQALAINPKDAIVYNNRGVAWKNKGEYGKAIADYGQAMTVNPQYIDAYGNLAGCWQLAPTRNPAMEKGPSRTPTWLINWTAGNIGNTSTSLPRHTPRAATSRRPSSGWQKPSNWRKNDKSARAGDKLPLLVRQELFKQGKALPRRAEEEVVPTIRSGGPS